jgi:hypothetical protein
MNLVQSSFWLQYVLNTLLAGATTGLYVRLCSNNPFPVNYLTALGAFTECVFPGYSAQQIGAWGAAAYVGSYYQIQAPVLVFTDTGAGPDNVYGYYVTNNTNTEWYWAQAAPSAPIVLGTSQPSLGVLPIFGYTDI